MPLRWKERNLPIVCLKLQQDPPHPMPPTSGLATAVNPPPLPESLTRRWTGTEMIVWGIEWYESYQHRWTLHPIDKLMDAHKHYRRPRCQRLAHGGVDGHADGVWGGWGYGCSQHRWTLNPSTNTWGTTTPIISEPVARSGHTAVWMGTAMIVWGGWDGGELFQPR